MNEKRHDVETLISRVLDREADAAQRRALDEALARDPAARALYDEYAALDAEAGKVLRRVMGRSGGVRALRFAPWFVTAAAAAAALVASIGPGWIPQPGSATNGGAAVHAGNPWFVQNGEAPTSGWPMVDTLVNPAAEAARKSSRDFIVMPGSAPGEILLIEVRRARPARPIELHGL
ncbi:MAG: hypothetical protein IPM64_11655 [Phycisphaerales bacterium]|nr:hypothetical protein [Phycisphaerales bacterium]